MPAAPTVLHVAQPLDGGVPHYVARLAADQRARGWAATIACPPASDLARLAAEAAVPVAPWPAGRSPGPAVPAEARRLAAVVARARPDVVHLHAAKAGLAGRLVLRGRRPTLYEPHAWSFYAAGGVLGPAAVAWERLGARWTDALVCVSNAERADGVAAGVRGRMEVVRNGVDLARFTPAGAAERAEARAALGLPAAAPLALCVGRVGVQKDQAALLAVWPAVRERVPGAELAVVGDGDDRPALEAAAPAGVRFAGAVADVRPWLAAADVVAQPSRWEGLALAPLEALARARPVVATDLPAMREGLAPGTGALVPPGDPAALTAALAARLADPALARAEGERGRAHVEAHHDERAHLDRIAALTVEVAARP